MTTAILYGGLAVSSCAGPVSPPSSSTAPNTIVTPSSQATSGTAAVSGTPTKVKGARATSSAATSATAVPTPDGPARALARLSRAQRVGQLIMVGAKATGASSSTMSAISGSHVGNVMLSGRSNLGIAPTATLTALLRDRATAEATARIGLFVATDQEGGQVQVLSGQGFSAIPSALTQGTWTITELQSRSAAWGRQLRLAGVNLNLAPVADTVSRASAESNRPIGFYQREFGFSTARTGSHASAFVKGMQGIGVAATPKHFPGLGRVAGNTDNAAGVTDLVTTRDSPDLAPFRQAIAAGASFMMMSSAYYSKIDAGRPACFSRVLLTDVLRGDLGFRGVVISDDLGSARQVAGWSPGSRATQFIAAGGDIVLTVDPALAPAMTQALLDKANGSATFRKQVDAAALRVLRAKADHGLLPTG